MQAGSLGATCSGWIGGVPVVGGAYEELSQTGQLGPETFDYAAVTQLRVEAKQKLAKVRPANVGQASRISGITPADLAVLLFYLE